MRRTLQMSCTVAAGATMRKPLLAVIAREDKDLRRRHEDLNNPQHFLARAELDHKFLILFERFLHGLDLRQHNAADSFLSRERGCRFLRRLAFDGIEHAILRGIESLAGKSSANIT